MAVMMKFAATLALLVLPLASCGGRPQTVKPAAAAPVAPAAATPAAPVAAPVPLAFDVLLFEYDQAEIADAHRDPLRKALDGLLAHAGTSINIEGHCDERGTDEYNLDLGWKRAYAVRDHLKRLGVDEARLFPVSYGRARPAVIGSDESVWRLNRRVEIAVRK